MQEQPSEVWYSCIKSFDQSSVAIDLQIEFKIKKTFFFNINAILMLINGCHGKTEDAEEKIVPLNEVSD